MPDANNAPELEQQTSADVPEIDLSKIPDQASLEDVTGLKSTLAKYKAQVAELSPLKAKAAIVDQLIAQGIKPEDIPVKLAAIQEQQKAEQLIEQRLAEAQAQARADQEILTQRYQGQISELTQQINAQTRRVQLETVLGKAGGNVADYSDFSAIASRYIEFGDDQAIKSFKGPDGNTLYVDDEKQVGKVRAATMDDFILKAKTGEYGKALQSILPAINQSSGAGLPGSFGVSVDGPMLLTQAQIDRMGEMTSAQLKDLKTRGYRVVG